MKYRILIITVLFTLLSSPLFGQSGNIVIKFKSNTPLDILTGFKNNSPSSGNNSVSRLSRDFNVRNSKEAFKIANQNNRDNAEYASIGLDRIFIAETDIQKMQFLVELGSKNEFIEYIQPLRVLKTDGISEASITPNDPYFSSQYYLTQVGMNNAWDVTQGDSSIIIAVVDTGMDFTHPDLQNSFWINNPGEYGDGRQDNGIDDDHNGFIDDWRGWDFTDEPFTGDPRRGDYLEPDNDPSDDNKQSHGTAAIGIINAAFNNNIGIASVAPRCKVLVLRAFDAEGFGEEDDVANAILYALSCGARVFNFSFGDYIFSNLLRDVIKFAYTKNVVIVCSAGNDGSDRLHYPSAYDEVISVGASDPTDNKASFSSYGETVDIFAPGFQNLTTVRVGKGSTEFGSNYDKLNGTSFAAPIVAGVAGLLISENPQLTNEEIRGILVSTTTLMPGQTTWDHIRASGRLNAFNAVRNFNNPAVARINYPFTDFTFMDQEIPICVSAASPLFLSYSVYYGIGQRPSTWIPLLENQGSQVLNDTVYRWNTTSLADTSYTLRLAINSNSGRSIEHRMIIFKDMNPPVITDIVFGNLIDKNNYSELILFAANKRTLGKIYYKRKNISEPYKFILADVGTPNIGFVAEAHFGLLSGNDLQPDTEYEFYIEATSLNGLTTTVSDTSFYFYTQPQINNYGYRQKDFTLPYSQSCNTIIDLTGNGKNDILLNGIDQNLRLNVYEFNSGSFTKISNDNWGDFRIARDVGDITGDGRNELLTSRSRDGYLYESPAIDQLPVNLVWSDTGNGNFWSSRFADTDGDGKKEILGFGRSGLRILEYNAGNYQQIANLNYFGTDSTPNSQNTIVEDFDNDGKTDIAFINLYYETKAAPLPKIGLSVYENTGDNNYTRVFKDSIDRLIKGDNIVTGDFNGDGKKDFALGVVSKDGDLIQYYSLYVYASTADNTYEIADIQDIYNYKSYAETSTKAGDVDADGRDEILVNTGTLFYIFKFNNSTGRFTPVFYKENINTVNQIVFDFDGNGVKEIGLNTTQDTLLFFEKDIAFTGPSTPLGLKGHSIDSNRIQLRFEAVAGADYYKIYKSDTTKNFTAIDSTASTQYEDTQVINKKNYFYRVTAVDLSNPVRESMPTNTLQVYNHNKPRIVGAHYEGNGFLTVELSQRISPIVPNLSSFMISGGIGNPKNIAIKNNFQFFLTFDEPMANGDYTIAASSLTDIYGSPVDTVPVSFNVDQPADSGLFYIAKLELAGDHRLKVLFNIDTDTITIKNTNNYSFEPFDIRVNSVELDGSDRRAIYLNLAKTGAIGATGKDYLLKAFNIYSATGIKIVDGAGSSFGLIFNKENLDEMYVYPNPYSASSGQNYITLANLTRDASIDIFDLTGKFLINIKETNGNGGVEWDLKDKNGNMIGTGIYLFRATGKNSSGQEVEEKIGKFAVVK